MAPSETAPAPVFVRPPVPETMPPRTASMAAVPSSTWRVRVVDPIAIGLAKVSVFVARALERISGEPSGTKLPEPQVSGAAAPPRFAVRGAPLAAKPPAAVNCTSPTPVPSGRRKSSNARSTTPPASVRPLVPPVVPMPPGRAAAVPSRSAPAATVVPPE